MGITKDYNKINGRKPPILRVFKFLAAEETQDRGPRFSQRAVQQDGDRGGESHHVDCPEAERRKYQLFSVTVS